MHFVAFWKIMILIREEKNKSIFLDCLNQVISHDLSEIGFTRKPIQKELMPDTHPSFRLMMMINGKHVYNILEKDGVKDITLIPDRALFCQRRGMARVPEYKKEASAVMFTIVFWPQYIRFLITNEPANDEKNQNLWYHSNQPINQSGIYILKTLDELVIADDSDIKACLLTKTLLHICRDNLINDNPLNVTKSFRTYQNIKVYLYENADKNINRASVAEVFKLTPSHISKLFAAYDEHNFNIVLKTLRLEHAVELLKETTFSIDEIAEQCGFVNTGYFIKTFRLFYGNTPSRFRQRKK